MAVAHTVSLLVDSENSRGINGLATLLLKMPGGEGRSICLGWVEGDVATEPLMAVI